MTTVANDSGGPFQFESVPMDEPPSSRWVNLVRLDGDISNWHEYGMAVAYRNRMCEALLDIPDVCAHNVALETAIFDMTVGIRAWESDFQYQDEGLPYV